MVLHPARLDKGTKLPLLLVATPGNVGVQIDSYRTKDVYNRPRSTRFTTAFHGIMFEDHRLHNAPRISARETQRKQYALLREEKLAAYERARAEHQLRIEEKRKHREYLRRQQAWEHQQRLKAAWERELENECASRIQALHRGYLVRKKLAAMNAAATQIQAHVRRMTARAEYKLELERAAAASLYRSAVRIQAQVRRHLVEQRYPRVKRPGTEAPLDTHINHNVTSTPLLSITGSVAALSLQNNENEATLPPATRMASPTVPTPPLRRPRTTVLKRVGGGFRKVFQNPLSTSVKPATAPSPRRPPQRPPAKATWNAIASRPWPQAKELAVFIQDPNLAEKLKILLPQGEAEQYSTDDVVALSGADDVAKVPPPQLEVEIRQEVLTAPVGIFSFGSNPLEVAEWSLLLEKDFDERRSPLTLCATRPSSSPLKRRLSATTPAPRRPFSGGTRGAALPVALAAPREPDTEVGLRLTYTPSSDEQFQALEGYSSCRCGSGLDVFL
ncbi:hypothetical protein ACHHYP_16837 [Achlya hypogyna]|uniref:Uncharacterized protein n=1 Tax=Achlya hypogyna TaxID=1202772 RepID=A0A1V9Y5N7_ACHHY|nr:hypothetical protein ACHHYP_16837 [Achlya hypogyna]